jgi:hypothetical protein
MVFQKRKKEKREKEIIESRYFRAFSRTINIVSNSIDV